jgi:hypothetical protein
VHATATAQWTKHPKSASVIPYLVSLCEYAQNRDTDTDVWLKTGVNRSLKKDLPSGKAAKESILGSGPGNLNMLDTCSRPSYVPADKVDVGKDGMLNILKGGLWVSPNDNSSAVCNEKLYAEVFVSPPATDGKNLECIDKWGDEVDPSVGGEILLAIYAPVGDSQYDPDFGGVEATPTTSFGSGNATLVDKTGKFKMKVVGFAPFHLVGYCLDGTSRCNGSGATADTLYGHFTSSTEIFDNIDEWSSTGTTDLGSTKIEMIN